VAASRPPGADTDFSWVFLWLCCVRFWSVGCVGLLGIVGFGSHSFYPSIGSNQLSPLFLFSFPFFYTERIFCILLSRKPSRRFRVEFDSFLLFKLIPLLTRIFRPQIFFDDPFLAFFLPGCCSSFSPSTKDRSEYPGLLLSAQVTASLPRTALPRFFSLHRKSPAFSKSKDTVFFLHVCASTFCGFAAVLSFNVPSFSKLFQLLIACRV